MKIETESPEVAAARDADRAASATLPVTPLQFGMIYHFLREGGGTGIDVVQAEVVLDAPVDPTRLAECWTRIAEREAVLRTAFAWDGSGAPEARVHPPSPVDINIVDLSDEADPPARYQALLEADRARGFDLAISPIFRVTLYRLGNGEERMVWTLHHVLADGTSYRLALDDVFRLYDSPDGIERALEMLPTRPSFASFLTWAAERDASGDEAFWKEALAGLDEPTTLPRRIGGRRTPGRWVYRTTGLDADDTARLRAAAEAHGGTLNTAIQAAWALALRDFTGRTDLSFGAIRGGRAGTVDGADRMVGLFINTVPMAVELSSHERVGDLLRALRERWVAMRPHEHASPSEIQQWSGVGPGRLLFESVLNVQEPFWGDALREAGDAWTRRQVEMHNPLVFPLTVAVNVAGGTRIRFEFDPGELDEDRLLPMLDTFRGYLLAIARGENAMLDELDPLDADARARIVGQGRGPTRELPDDATIHGLFEEAAARHADRDAILFRGRGWSFGELDRAANRVAHALIGRGVRPGDRVVVSQERGLCLPAALLGVMKAGAAYVPVDPRYPEERVRMMLDDARPAAIVTDRVTRPRLPVEGASVPVIVVEEAVGTVPRGGDVPPGVPVDPSSLAYMIYTSGSTGRPKGVMVEHRNVVNFFIGMDDAVGVGPGDRWLAVTSISFDISVLEILWTLTRGAEVVLHAERPPVGRDAPDPGCATSVPARGADDSNGSEQIAYASVSNTDDRASPKSRAGKEVAFSLFFFSAEGEVGEAPPRPGRDRYRLMLEGARFADENGFSAVWTPERHFHEFGGIYPNPSVTGAALAAMTEQVQIRSGSVVLPLHDPIRVAEEWSVVDNLSNGRVGLSFASGWHDRDFVFRPENYEDRRDGMFEQIQTVRKLWRGQAIDRVGPSGQTHSLRLHPRPVQPELPFWITAGGTAETFRKAGEVGGYLLTHLLGQKPEELRDKIRIYREAWREAGHPGNGYVSLMLHTYVGTSMEEVLDRVRAPFRNYLRTAVGLIKAVAAEGGRDLRDAKLTEAEMDALLDHAFERYFETSSLMGTPERCLETMERMRDFGADEMACLIDFGVDEDAVLEGLGRLADVARRANESIARDSDEAPIAEEIPTVSEALLHSGATHLQCTPSQATMLLAEERADEALAGLQTLLIGGEAFGGTLAARLRERMARDARLLNMYGPTETTVWSAVREVTPDDVDRAVVSLGTPIANTELIVADEAGRLLPNGVEGDLLIGGAGVVRGYFDRDELTAERFRPSPIPEVAGRVYDTGDRVRRGSDGTLEFLGRADHQVKLLGHRIELGEIEAALEAHPDVASAVVALHRASDGDTADVRLVGYVVPRADAPERGELRDFLRERLPDVMIPADVVALDAFPLTPNGKVDRKRLPAPGGVPEDTAARSPESAKAEANDAATPTAGLPASASVLEREIAEVWRDVLGVADLSPNDNFFEIGGHSLLAVRVHARLSERTAGRLTLVDLFRFPTVASLAAHLASMANAADAGNGKVEEGVGDARDRAASRREALLARGARRRPEPGASRQ